MFYSHQLLARKAPLGQIWIAATLNSKIKRRNLDKLNIPRICEEILNPSIPMALRLSGILMGGVVNVFKRKVDCLYADVNRLLEDLNRVFRAKVAGDSIGKNQAKGKAQAKSEADITIEDKDRVEVDTEQYTIRHSIPLFDVGRFQNMTLEDLDNQYINICIDDDDNSDRQRHQANLADITLPDNVDFGTMHIGAYDRFERFDIEDDIFSQNDFMSQVLPDSLPQASSPLRHAPELDHVRMNKNLEAEKKPSEAAEPEVEISAKEEPGLCRPTKRKVRRNYNKIIIDELIMIPSQTYHSWLEDASDISSQRRRGKTKPVRNLFRSTKIEILMDLPPLFLMSSSTNLLRENCYPEPLLELWWKYTMGNPQTPQVTAKNCSASHSYHEKVHQAFPEFPEQVDFDIEGMVAADEDLNLAPWGIPGGTSTGSHGDTAELNHSSGPGRNSLNSGR